MAITNAVTDLISSFLELFSSLFHAVFTIAHSFIAGILGLFNGFFIFIGDIFKGVFDVVGGVGRFLAGNIVILGLIAAAGYAYVRFAGQQTGRSGRPVANGVGKGLKTQ
ncbi:hypothetical protein QBC40DRAFT_277037 [Triangularia verruculosa]|uniref:Uncharacterized protein n=1 Tax=Triangularia verruculosa TaxID=2587418 RepID=A0AAN6XK72_9PEZI|nr:hypothetical protein QBC40DRAFT_277037 [Triangularia verruculosa]